MKKVENALARHLNEDKTVPYPDFESMWSRMEQSGDTSPVVSSRLEASGQRRNRSWRKVTLVASLTALLAAVPVYAAVHYDWGNLLRERGGIQAAIAQNLGQQLDQTLTRDGVTLSLHTAIVDENRTVILYSLDIENAKVTDLWNIKDMSLKDAKGNSIEGEFHYQLWDEKNQRYNGYFESEWTPSQDIESVQLVAGDLRSYSQQEQDLALDISSAETQSFPIGKGGLDKIEVKPFKQSQDKLLFSSGITFDQPEAKGWAAPRIVAYNNGTPVKELAGSTFGQPGENGEYTAQQHFKTLDVPEGQTTYKLQYTKIEKSITGPWAFDLQLSKKQMESGTIKTRLNVPLAADSTGFALDTMVVTPTQIRVTISKEKHTELPYKQYELEVDGRKLPGNLWRTEDNPSMETLRFERPADLVITKDTPITFVGKYKVTHHEGDKKTPFQLSNISEEKQSQMEQIGGYPVEWTYYMQDGDLYVETGSEDAHFGGVNQTHIGLGNERIIGRPVTVNFSGDGNNKAIDVYKDFKGTEASIYMFYYTTDEPDQETRMPLQRGAGN